MSHRWYSIKWYHSVTVRTRERWQQRGTQHSPKLKIYWSLIVRLFNAISRSHIEEVLLHGREVLLYITFAWINVCMRIYVYIHTYIHIYIHTYIHTYIHNVCNMYVFVCVYIYIYMKEYYHWTICTYKYLSIYLSIFTKSSARAWYDTRSIFKRSLTVLNSEF